MGGSKHSGGGGTTTIQYEHHIVDHHTRLMNSAEVDYEDLRYESPYDNYTDIDVDVAFFGTGYLISSFPSLYDMYGKFMAGVDIESLWDTVLNGTIGAAEIGNLTAAEGLLLSDEIESNVLPRFEEGMRDINAVQTSSFVIGKSLIEAERIKNLAKFDAELRYRMVPVAVEKWKTHLQWRESVVRSYAEIVKLYFSAKMDITEYNYSMAARDTLWPFTVTEYYRTVVGTLNGAQESRSDTKGTSTTAKVIGGALSGAAAGAMIGAPTGVGAPIGAAVGGVLGAAAGLL